MSISSKQIIQRHSLPYNVLQLFLIRKDKQAKHNHSLSNAVKNNFNK